MFYKLYIYNNIIYIYIRNALLLFYLNALKITNNKNNQTLYSMSIYTRV